MNRTYNPLGEFLVEDDQDDPEAPESGEGESPDDSPEDEGETPQKKDTNRAAEQDRKIRELEESLMNTVAENAVLKSRLQPAGAPEKKRYTVDQFKELAEKEDGKFLFDAAAGYANQVKDETLEEIDARIAERQEQALIAETVREILPGWDDPASDTYKAIAQEKARLVAKGLRNDARAQEAAMFRVAHRIGKPQRESKEELERRRRQENAGGEGAPTRGERADRNGQGDEVTDKMSREDLETARRMGLKSIFDPDPKKRSHARRVFNQRKKNYAEKRV